jgi:hypothetical protein
VQDEVDSGAGAPGDEQAVEVLAIAEMDGSALIAKPEVQASELAETDERALAEDPAGAEQTTDERVLDERAIADIDGEAVIQPPTKDPVRWSRPGSRAIATLLACAAILAALITTRASMLSGASSDGWQTAVRDEVKRSTAMQEDARYLYQNLLPVAMNIETARVQQDELKKELAAHPEAAARLNLEINALEQVQQGLKDSSPLTGQTDIALPSGGWDLGSALAQQRNTTPDLVAIDPGADRAKGDDAAGKARRISLATIPIAIGVLLAALAEPFVSWRRRLVWTAAVLVAAGALAWIVVELLT